MIKCPFCHFENEEGALFCERCTSDLGAVASATPPKPVVPPIPVPAVSPPAIPIPEPVPFEAIPIALAEPLDAIPLATAEAVMESAVPMAPSIPIALETLAPEPQAPMPELDPTRATSPAPLVAPPVSPSPAPAVGATLPPGAQPRLLVLRGQKRNVEYPLYEGLNFIGRADEKPVDIDLEEQEPPDRIWCSRQHACVTFEADQLLLEDLNSANGTYVNRTRVYPGQKRTLLVNDIIQIGNVQLKVLA
jgi:hypothetical protein